MKLGILLIVIAASLFTFSPKADQRKVEVLVKDISIFNPRSGTFLPNRDVVVSDTKIAEILPSGTFKGIAKTVINGTGKYAIPGLFDNHVHAARLNEQTAGIFLSFGVTSVRDMGTEPPKIEEWRKRIAYGKFYGPRIVQACGPMLESKGEERKDHWVVTGPESARETVSRIADAGMDCVKLRTFKDEETYLAIAAAADKHGLMLVGHAPEQLAPMAALKAGQRTFEHAFYPYPLSKLTENEKHNLFAAFKTSKAAIVPTFVAWKPFTQSASELEQKVVSYDEGNGFVLPQELLDHWKQTIETHRKQKRGSKGWQDAVITASRDVGEMSAAGVLILPGSDTGAPFVVPGLAIHEEFKLLVYNVGMTPAEVLKAATIDSAIFYGRDKDLGSIETGKIADFVILNKNPLERIENTLEIDAVVFRGEALSRAHLNIFFGKTKAASRE